MVQIFSIPVLEAFEAAEADKSVGCPYCKIYRELQSNELDIILGASMMEPDIRIKTNELGFCNPHYSMMLTRRRMLGMGLMMESHLAEVKARISKKALVGAPGSKSLPEISKLNRDCYVCERINRNMDAVISTTVYLYEKDENDFRRKFRHPEYFCLPHYSALMEYAAKKMDKKLFREFYGVAEGIEEKYIETLSGDVSWFCKKFDYRYDEEPWYNSKDSVQRSIKFLTGSMEDEGEKGRKS